MAAPCTGWNANTGLCSTWATYSPAIQAYAQRFAIYVLWAATGRQFGLCPYTVRPCETPNPLLYRTYPVGAYGPEPYVLDGVAGGVVLGYAAAGDCLGGHCAPPEIALPGPVSSITQILVDGVVLNPANYRLDGTRLVRQDGLGWPAQDLSLAAGAVGTWSVEYLRGLPVPDLLNDAAGAYACEIAKSRAGGTCQLPSRVSSISRQGVDVQFVSAEDYLDKGRTGYAEVDQIIATFNPDGLRRAPRVLSLDSPTFR
jgi:hypothetical protein